MTDDSITLKSLFNTPQKRWKASLDFGAGLIGSALLIGAAWVLAS